MSLLKIACYPHTIGYMSIRHVSAYYLLGTCVIDGIHIVGYACDTNATLVMVIVRLCRKRCVLLSLYIATTFTKMCQHYHMRSIDFHRWPHPAYCMHMA